MLKNKIFIIIVLSYIVSIVYSFWHNIAPIVDAQAYDHIAMNLISEKGFREDASVSYNFDTAILRAGPGYEFFLAAVYFIFGHHYEAVWIIQALLHAATVWLVYLIAIRLWRDQKGKTIGLIAAVIIGLHPDLIEISAMLMTETLYLFFTVLTIYIFSILYDKPAQWNLALALGVVCGSTILTRPTVIFFVPIFAFFYIHRRAYTSLTVFFLGISGVLLPWILRNYGVYHSFILTTLIGEYNLWVGNTLSSTGGQISSGFNPVTHFVDTQGVVGLGGEAKKHFFSFVYSYPLIFIKLCIIRTIRYFSLIRPMGFWFYQTGISQLVFVVSSGLWNASTFVWGIAGMWYTAWYKRASITNYLILLALTAPLALIPTVVESRYRFQIYPFLALFAGYMMVQFREKIPQAKKSVYAFGSLLCIVSFVDVLTFWPTVIEHLKIFWK